MMNVLFLPAFFGYISILIFIGWTVSKRQKSSSDFIIGDRSVNYWVTAIATHATDMSAWLFMALPGAIYLAGPFACWRALGLLTFMFLTWQFVAKKLRLATEAHGAITLSSYFEKRFSKQGDKSGPGLIRIVSAAVALFFFAAYISAGIVALGRALEATFGFSYHTGITLGTLTVALYTILGGFVAVAWNDFFQGLFVLLIIVIFPLFALHHVGGFPAILQAAAAKNISLSLFPDLSVMTIYTIITLFFGWGLGYFGQPHILVNFMGIDNPQNIRKAKYVGLSWQFVTLSAATLVGLIGIAFFKQPLVNNELVFINMVQALVTPFFAGLLLCAILAAAISTMDSQILVSASMLTQDIYKKIFNRKASQKKLLAMSRISAVGIVVFSYLMAVNASQSILDLVGYAWFGLGSAFGPVLLFSLYSKKITRSGALAGIVVGAFTAASWKFIVPSISELTAIVGFAASTLAILVVSRLSK